MIYPLRQKRFEKQMSQHLLSYLTGIPQSKLSLCERRLVKLKGEEQERIARALNVVVEELFEADKNDGSKEEDGGGSDGR